MRVVSPDKVWRLCEVVEGSDGGLPRLKAHISIVKALGISQAGWAAIVAVFDGNDARSLSSVPSVRNCRPLHVLNSDGFEVRRYCPRAPHRPRPPTVTHGLSLTGEVCLASWNVNGMFVASAHDRDRYRGKLRTEPSACALGQQRWSHVQRRPEGHWTKRIVVVQTADRLTARHVRPGGGAYVWRTRTRLHGPVPRSWESGPAAARAAHPVAA